MNATSCGGMATACSCLAVSCLMLLMPCSLGAAGTPAGTSIDNQATVVYTAGDSTVHRTAYGNHISFTIGHRAVVNLAPALGGKNAHLGDVVDYPVVITNSGNGIDSFSMKAVSSLGLAVTLYHDANHNGSLDASEIAAGPFAVTTAVGADSIVAIIARVRVSDSAALNGKSDLLAVTATSLFDADRYATAAYTTGITSAALIITSAVSNPTPQASSRVTYSIACSNAGSARADAVVVTDLLHPMLHYVTGSGVPQDVAILGGTMIWNLGAIEAGASKRITFSVGIDDGLTPGMVVHNAADATYMDGLITRTTISTESSFITIASGVAQTVTIGPSGNAAGESGDTITFPLIVANTGLAGRDFELHATSTKGMGWIFIRDINGNGRFDAGEPDAATTGAIPAGGRMQFLASSRLPVVAIDRSVDSTRFIARSISNGNNVAECLGLTVIGRPMMTLRKSAVASNPASGGEITYRIEYANKGSGHAERFRVVDTLPGHTTLVNGSLMLNSVPKTEMADSDEATVLNNTLTIDIGEVAPESTGIIEFNVRID
ncbi:MAG: hypothetical protein ABIR47_15180 [Candidatus Kapaibacterium sp.]